MTDYVAEDGLTQYVTNAPLVTEDTPIGPTALLYITDNSGDFWSFGAIYPGNNEDYQVLHNGIYTWNAMEIASVSGNIYVFDSYGQWFSWNGTTFVLMAGVPHNITQVLPVGGTVTSPSAQSPPPPLPAIVSGVYYVRLWDGDDTADGQTVPWQTISKANSAPAGSTVKFWGGDSFPVSSVSPAVGNTITSFGTGQAIFVDPFINLPNNTTLDNINALFSNLNFGIDIVGHDVAVKNCTIGGRNPWSSAINGIFVNFYTYNISIKNNEIRNIGGDAGSPTQSGFGIHTSGVFLGPGSMTPVPFTFSAGVPTNALIEIAGNTIHDCGYNITNSGGGGPSGIEIGQGDRQWVHDNIVYNIQPNYTYFTGGTDFDPIDAGDSGATNTLVERNFCYNSYGGLIDFDSGSGWGPSIIRYNLTVNCGQGKFASAAVQGLGNFDTHQWYGNTFIQTTSKSTVLGSNQTLLLYQTNNINGVFANNILVTFYPNFAVTLNGGQPSSSFHMNNNCWYGAGAGFNAGGGAIYSTYAAFAAAFPHFDQTGIAVNPTFVGSIGSTTPTDYKLQSGSPCLGTGLDLTTLGIDVGSTDFFGNPVRSGAPNIGAGAFQ